MPSADFWQFFPTPLDAGSTNGKPPDLPGYCALTFPLMPVGSTSQRSVQESGFASMGLLTPLHRLSIRFLFVRPAFCLQLPPDPASRRAALLFG